MTKHISDFTIVGEVAAEGGGTRPTDDWLCCDEDGVQFRIPKRLAADEDIARELLTVMIPVYNGGFGAGRRAGRAEIVGTVHELLGVEQIVDALRERGD